MTCIVGIAHEGRVYIGGDSAGVSETSMAIRADNKVFTKGSYVFGFIGSFRMGQLLRYALAVPKPPTRGLDRFMVTTFVDAVRECYEEGGCLTVKNNVQEGNAFLVGVSGRLYGVDTDFQIERTLNGYQSIGIGEDLALGSLHTTATMPWALSPRSRVKYALEAAGHHSTGVSAPFTVKSQ